MSNASGPGQQAAVPVVIYNPPGLSAISYRVGDYTSFREALLQNLPGEVELQGWRPTDDGGDLALQLLEWWAYIADILTFYNERIANNSYLGTAVLPASAQPQTGSTATALATASSGTPGLPDNATLIAQVAGYRSSPGLAATGQLAVLVNSTTPISLPPLFAVQSKPGPGQQPQVFEAVASADTYLPTDSGGAVPVDVFSATFFIQGGITTSRPPALPASQKGPLLKGAITSIKAGDMVVVAPTIPPFGNAKSMAVTVQTVTTETDPRGRTNTRLGFMSFTPATYFTSTDVINFQVLRSIQSAPTYSVGGAPVLTGPLPATPSDPLDTSNPIGVHLASLVRDIAVGDLVVLEIITTATPPPASVPNYVTAAVTAYQETIWYANADDPVNSPQLPPNPATNPQDPPNLVPIPIPHTFLTLETGVLGSNIGPGHTVTRVWYGYRPVSVLLDEMPRMIPEASSIAKYSVQPVGAVNTVAQNGATVLLEGADGLGTVATLTATDPIALTSSATTPPLALPLRLLYNVFNVTAGKTVTNEVLGNGDATVASQSFTLQKSPLTFLKNTNPSSPTSTLKVQVDNVTWTEVQNFNNQPRNAKAFVTQEDKNQKTTVTFGDGVNGARLTTGTGNVTATYRYGSGPGDPSLGGPTPTTLVTVLTPYPGLGSVRNPVAMTGGAAPSTPTQVQQSAPDSMLTFGRAVSPSDYEAIAAQAPSVTRARAQTVWDPQGQRTVLTVYVGGGPDAVAETQAALAKAADPNRAVVVSQGTEVDLQLAFIVTYDPTVGPAAVRSGVIAALTDPGTGLFAPSQSRIGDPFYDSRIYAACQGVAGVLAVRGLTISNITNPAAAVLLTDVKHAPGPGSFFALDPTAVNITLEAADG